jgi:DNA-binding response OmpR family regulator
LVVDDDRAVREALRRTEEAGARGLIHTVRGVGYALREP